uniref:Saposin B-type domain-containing protein n=1 Tax=Ditylenchus dipsaci TaxID=166011 RepID=A0A915DKB7_9BILA
MAYSQEANGRKGRSINFGTFCGISPHFTSSEHKSIMGSTTLIAFILFMLFITQRYSFAKANSHDIMSCVLCEMVVEAMTSQQNPAAAMTSMYRKCSRMGLLSPVCDQLVGTNAKILLLHMGRTNRSPRRICSELKLCDETL